MSFTGGKLKLKGQDAGTKKKKKKKSSRDEKALALVEGAPSNAVKETPDGYVLDPHAEVADRRTAAEKRYDEMQAKREREMAAKLAAKSHRERVNEFNAYLQNLSEHHDIPKVGPG
ncbi:probable protein FAM32A at C-terminar half [Coccomyxa sp. Obi]|nr:probable protein FAM32A at C-terminar half [Coccomyxa sp. Obi]